MVSVKITWPVDIERTYGRTLISLVCTRVYVLSFLSRQILFSQLQLQYFFNVNKFFIQFVWLNFSAIFILVNVKRFSLCMFTLTTTLDSFFTNAFIDIDDI